MQKPMFEAYAAFHYKSTKSQDSKSDVQYLNDAKGEAIRALDIIFQTTLDVERLGIRDRSCLLDRKLMANVVQLGWVSYVKLRRIMKAVGC